MTKPPKDGTPSSLTFVFDVGELDSQFDAIERSVDGEAKSDAATSVHAYEAQAKLEMLQGEVDKLKEENRSRAATTNMRSEYATGAISLARAAVMFWVGMFSVVGFSNAMAGKVPFSDQALVTLTAGATVNVLAAFIGIIRGLFPPVAGKSNGDSD